MDLGEYHARLSRTTRKYIFEILGTPTPFGLKYDPLLFHDVLCYAVEANNTLPIDGTEGRMFYTLQYIGGHGVRVGGLNDMCNVYIINYNCNNDI